MNKRLATVLVAMSSLGLSGTVLAQNSSTFNGNVVSGEDGSPVIGATVKVAGTSKVAVTDINGNFAINAPAGAKLEISYVGMNPMSVKAG